MKVLHVTPWFPPAWRYGGPVVSVDRLAHAQCEQGAEVTVLTTDADGDGRVASAPLESRDGVRVRTFRTAFPRRLFHAPGLATALPEELAKADVVHVHGLFHAPGLLAARRARALKVPLVVSPRGMLVDELIRARSTFAKRAWLSGFPLEGVGRWFASSDRERSDLVRMRISRERVRVLPNGVEQRPEVSGVLREDVNAVVARPGYVLYLGRLSWKKGVQELIEAWRSMAERTRLVLVGPDDEGLVARLKAVDGELFGKGQLVHLPLVERVEATALLRGAACLALLSQHENFGNVVFEALAEGTPVLVSDKVGAGEWVAEAGAGWVTPVERARGVLAEVLGDEDERARRGQRGRALVERWTWARVAGETLLSYPVERATSR